MRARPGQVPGPQVNGSVRGRRLLGTQATEGRRVAGDRGRQDGRGGHGVRRNGGSGGGGYVPGRRGREQGQGPLGREAEQAGKAGHFGLWLGFAWRRRRAGVVMVVLGDVVRGNGGLDVCGRKAREGRRRCVSQCICLVGSVV